MADDRHDVAVRLTANAAQYVAEMAKAVRSVDQMAMAEKKAAAEAAKAARDQEREAKKIAAAQAKAAKEAQSSEQKQTAANQKAAREAERAAQKQEQAAARIATAHEAASKRSARAAATTQAQYNSQLAGAGAGAMASGRSMVGTALTLGGGVGIVAAIKSAKEFNATVTDIAITAGNKSKSWTTDLEKRIVSLSNKFGIAKEKVADYIKAYVEKTGDVKTAMSTVSQMTKVAVASGAEMGNLALLSADLSGTMKVDPYKALNILRAQEKLGAFTLKDSSSIMGKLIGATGGFGQVARGEKGVSALGGLMQITKRTTNSSADEIQTGISRFMERLARDPEKIAKMLGADVAKIGRRVNGRFMFNDLEGVFRSLGEAGYRNAGKAQKHGTSAFGEEGVRVFQSLTETAKAGWGKSAEKGGAAGFFATSPGDVLDIDAKQRMASEAHKIDQAWTKISNELHRAVLPALQLLAKIAPSLVTGFKFIVNNAKDLAAMFVILKASAFYASLALKGAAGGGAAGAATSAAAAAAASRGAGAAGAAGAGMRGAMGAAGAGLLAGLPAFALMAGGYGVYRGVEFYRQRARANRQRAAGHLGIKTAGLDFADPLATSGLGLFGAGTGYYTSTTQGVKDTKSMNKLMSGWVNGDTANIDALLKNKGLKGTENTLYELKDIESKRREIAAAQLTKQGKEVTEENLKKIDPELAKLGNVIAAVDKTLAKILSGEAIQVTALVNMPVGEPGQRAENNANVVPGPRPGPWKEETFTGMFGGISGL